MEDIIPLQERTLNIVSLNSSIYILTSSLKTKTLSPHKTWLKSSVIAKIAQLSTRLVKNQTQKVRGCLTLPTIKICLRLTRSWVYWRNSCTSIFLAICSQLKLLTLTSTFWCPLDCQEWERQPFQGF